MSNSATKSVSLPASGLAVITSYQKLDLGGKEISTPYFINEGKRVAYSRGFKGKGTAKELEVAAKEISQKEQFSLKGATSQEITLFLLDHDLGIDCSGFVSWVLDGVAKEASGKRIWQIVSFSSHALRPRLLSFIRPIENLSVKILTSFNNAKVIADINEIQPGDMIATSEHIVIVTKRVKDSKDKAIRIEFAQSLGYEKRGVVVYELEVTDPRQSLLKQKWPEGVLKAPWMIAAMRGKEELKVYRLYNFPSAL